MGSNLLNTLANVAGKVVNTQALGSVEENLQGKEAASESATKKTALQEMETGIANSSVYKGAKEVAAAAAVAANTVLTATVGSSYAAIAVPENTKAAEFVKTASEQWEQVKKSETFGAIATGLEAAKETKDTILNSAGFSNSVTTAGAAMIASGVTPATSAGSAAMGSAAGAAGSHVFITAAAVGLGVGAAAATGGVAAIVVAADIARGSGAVNRREVMSDEKAHLVDFVVANKQKEEILKNSPELKSLLKVEEIPKADPKTLPNPEDGLKGWKDKLKDTTVKEAANFLFNNLGSIVVAVASSPMVAATTIVAKAGVALGLVSNKLDENEAKNKLKVEIGELRKEGPQYNMEASRKYDLAQIALKEKIQATALNKISENPSLKNSLEVLKNDPAKLSKEQLQNEIHAIQEQRNKNRAADGLKPEVISPKELDRRVEALRDAKVREFEVAQGKVTRAYGEALKISEKEVKQDPLYSNYQTQEPKTFLAKAARAMQTAAHCAGRYMNPLKPLASYSDALNPENKEPTKAPDVPTKDKTPEIAVAIEQKIEKSAPVVEQEKVKPVIIEPKVPDAPAKDKTPEIAVAIEQKIEKSAPVVEQVKPVVIEPKAIEEPQVKQPEVVRKLERQETVVTPKLIAENSPKLAEVKKEDIPTKLPEASKDAPEKAAVVNPAPIEQPKKSQGMLHFVQKRMSEPVDVAAGKLADKIKATLIREQAGQVNVGNAVPMSHAKQQEKAAAQSTGGLKQ